MLEVHLQSTGDAEHRYPCPCCGRRTLTELYNAEEGTGYDICNHCRWEDDGTTKADAGSSVNRGTMAQYRARLLKDLNYYFQEKWHK
ncbi:CPCC family cysteine-rich protein [Comamonas sp. JC664]|uniref:CPCC family cysteine-rich protein n=1 Tax=Comamonas sp. JC664 TaxID=2801917 RepID=UPI00174A0C08|nr:hypothetical protein [Comamonas sp. JC664]